MDKSSFPFLYVSLLIGLLSFAAIAIFRQIFKTRRSESRLSKLEAKLTKEKGTVEEYYELGSIYLDKRIYTRAIALFQRALKAEDLPEKESALIYNALGFAYSAQEQYDLAIRQYKEALKIDPGYVIAINNIGFAYERKQLTSQAIESYEQALKIDPNNTTAKRRCESLRKRLVSA